MQPEIEVKFLNVDFDSIRSKLQAIGATLEQPMRDMRRTILDYPDKRLQRNNWGRLRVRDEGDKITMSYKRGNDKEYSQEVELVVDSYDRAVDLLRAAGLEAVTVQESRRETWRYRDTEVVLDEWPWLKPYIEIEGPDEAAIKECVTALGLDWSERAFGNIDTAYRAQYAGIKPTETVGEIASLRFDDPMPEWLKRRQMP